MGYVNLGERMSLTGVRSQELHRRTVPLLRPPANTLTALPSGRLEKHRHNISSVQVYVYRCSAFIECNISVLPRSVIRT